MKFLRYIMVMALVVSLSAASGPELVEEAEVIEWISFEEAVKRNKKVPKKIMVDFYTDWCGYCKKMDREVFARPQIARYLNENFYAVKFNAEKVTNDIEFHGKTFKFVPPPQGGRRGIHELAYALMDQKASYPTTVFIDEELNPLQAIPGYHAAPFFDTIINYIGGDNYKKTPWNQFQAGYQSSIK